MIAHLEGLSVYHLERGCVQDCIDFFVHQYKPEQWSQVQYVLLIVGAHDLCQGKSVDHTIKRYRTLVNVIRARLGDIKVVICSVPPRLGLIYSCGIEFNNELVKLAAKLGVKFHRLHNAFVSGRTAKAAYYLDGVRLSETGLKVIVKVLKDYKSKLYL